MTVWGIDPSTRLIAVAVAGPHSFAAVESLALDQVDGRHVRLARAVEELVPWFTRLSDRWPAPRLVVLEQPFGKNVHPQSHYMVAAVQIALVLALGRSVDVRMIPPPKWKKVAWGRGDLGKDDLMVLARRLWPVESQDEADAVGIAVAARTFT